jgi:hypothetical protein
MRNCCRNSKISKSFALSVMRLTAMTSNTNAQTNKITRKNIFPSLAHLSQTKPRKLNAFAGLFQVGLSCSER